MAVAWDAGGYRVLAWRVFRVDRATWADGDMLPDVDEVSVSRDVSDHGTIERGTMGVTTAVASDFEEGYYRVCMLAEQGGATERVDVATLLCGAASDVVDRGARTHEITGRSVLWPASVRLMPTGGYAPSGGDGVAWAERQLSACLNAPVEASGGFRLDDTIVFDQGTSVLDAVWQVLDAGSHVLQVDGRGTVRVRPMPTEPSLVLDRAGARLVQPEFSRRLDYSEVPNRYFAVFGGEVEGVTNDDPASATSTVARGWASDVVDTSPVRVDGESPYAYVRRKLTEASTVSDERTYTREWWPDTLPFDVVRGTLSSVGFDGDFRVVSQQVTCGAGITVEERASREVRLWPTS